MNTEGQINMAEIIEDVEREHEERVWAEFEKDEKQYEPAPYCTDQEGTCEPGERCDCKYAI
jgi:hypothetical protein